MKPRNESRNAAALEEFAPPLDVALDDERDDAAGAGDGADDLLDAALDGEAANADIAESADNAPPADTSAGPANWGVPASTIDAAEENALVSAARGGDSRAREQLVRANYRAITWIARRYRSSGVPLDDLVNEGAIGVLTAIDRFDTGRGARFETYARWWILDAMRGCVMRQSRTVRLPVNVVKEIGSVDRLLKASTDTPPEARTAPTRGSVIEHVARRLQRTGMQVERLLALREPALPLESIADRADDEGDDGATRWSPEATAAMKQILGHLERLMGSLDARERRVLVGRYGLDNGAPLSLEELGGELKLTAERVRQIQNEALRKLRASFVAARLLPEGETQATPPTSPTAPAPARPTRRGAR